MAFQWGQTIQSPGDWNQSQQIQEIMALQGQKLGEWVVDPNDPTKRYMDTQFGRITQDQYGNTDNDSMNEAGNLGKPAANSWNTALGIGRHANEHGSDGILGNVNDQGILDRVHMNRESNATMNAWLGAMATLGIGGALAGGAVAGGAGGGGVAAGAGGASGMGAGGGLTLGSGGVTGLTAGSTGMGLTGAGAGGAAGTGGLFSAGAGMGTGAAAAGGAGMFAQLANGNIDYGKLIGGVGSNIIGNNQQQDMNRAVQEANAQSIAAARESGQSVTDAAATARNRVLQAGQQAADMSQFTPYNISGGLAGAQFGPDGVTKTLDPRMKAIQDQNLSLSSGFLNSVNAGTPEQLAQQAYEKYNQWARPQQDQQFSSLQDRLAGQGLIGLNVNTGSVSGNGMTSVNPYYKDFAEGVNTSNLKNYENSMRFGQEVTNNQLGMGNQQLGQAVGIDNMGNEAIKLGQGLGDSRAAAGYRAGGFLTGAAAQGGAWDYGAAQQAGSWYNNAAQNAAMNLSGRRQSEAQADGQRDQNIWNSIWGSVL